MRYSITCQFNTAGTAHLEQGMRISLFGDRLVMDNIRLTKRPIDVSDLNLDGEVDIDDIAIFAEHWLEEY